MNTYAANVPGPPVPLYFAAAPVLEVFQVVPILGNVSLGVGALSYAGQFNITAVADRELCPDLEVFVHGAPLAGRPRGLGAGVHRLWGRVSCLTSYAGEERPAAAPPAEGVSRAYPQTKPSSTLV
jgi:hypothetical protein